MPTAYSVVESLKAFLLTVVLYLLNHRVRQAGAGGWSWSGVREKHCYLTGVWRLVLEQCERNTVGLEAGAGDEHGVQNQYYSWLVSSSYC